MDFGGGLEGLEEERVVEGVGNEVLMLMSLCTAVSCVAAVIYLCFSQRVGVTIDPSQLPLVAIVRRRIFGAEPSETDENGLPTNYPRPATVYNSSDHQCPICLATVHLPVTTSCGHVFCGSCLMECWNVANSRVSAISCPVCRSQVTLMLSSFNEASPSGSAPNPLIGDVRLYNRRFSGAPRPLLDYLRDIPVVLPYLIRNLFSLDGIMAMFRLRVVICFIAALLYLLSPLDIVPEAVFGVIGLFDDLFVLFLLAVYITVAYRRALGS